MKKMILTVAVALITLGVMAAGPDQKVLDAFNQDFKSAKEVEWTAGINYYRATFSYNDKHVFAYYDLNGELMGLTRYISISDLPMMLQGNLKKDYSDYWISDLFEVANNEGTSYYVTLENADTKMVLKASDGKSWRSYSKVKKS
jgi:hypothetical protein